MKKKLLILVSAMALLLTACGGSGSNNGGGSGDSKGTYNFTIGSGHNPAGFPYVSACSEYFIPYAKEKAADLGYTLNFNEAWGGTIAPLADVWEATESGQLDIGVGSLIFENQKAKLINYNAYMPFGVDDISDCYNIGIKIYEANKDAIDGLFEKSNMHYLGLAIPISSYNLLTQFEVTTFADLAGHKIAAAGANLSLLNNTGAVGVNSNLGEAYTSLQSGVYEGWVIWPEGTTSYKLQEVAPYYLKTGFGASNYQHIMFNLDVWNDLPDDLKGVFEDALDYYIEHGIADAIESDAAAYAEMEAQGVKIATMSEEERNKWMDAMEDTAAPIIEELENEGLPGEKVFSDWYKYAEEAGYTFHRKFGQ